MRIGSWAVKCIHPDRHHARYVGIGLRNGSSRFQAGHALITEAGQFQIVAIKRQRHQNIEILVYQPEPVRHHTDDLARFRSIVMLRPITEPSPPKRLCQ